MTKRKPKPKWPATHMAEIAADAFDSGWGDERDLMNNPPQYTKDGTAVFILHAVGRVDALRLEGNRLYDCPTGELLKELEPSVLEELRVFGEVHWIWPDIRLFPVRSDW